MVTEVTKFNPYDIVDTGLRIFMGVLLMMFLLWCIVQIVKYCKIIKENFTESKMQPEELDELHEIQNSVNATLAKIKSGCDDE